MVETMGLEPTTSCLQSRCSSQLSYVPEAPKRSGRSRSERKSNAGLCNTVLSADGNPLEHRSLDATPGKFAKESDRVARRGKTVNTFRQDI